MTTLSEIKQTLKQVRDDANLRYAKCIEDAGSAPTTDSQGRRHAPCDGYLWGGHIFNGGEFLPDDEDYCGSSWHEIKIKVATSIIPELMTVLNGSTGKAWQQDGVEIAYFYAQVSKREKTALSKVLDSKGKKLVLIDELPATTGSCGKAWKFNLAPFIKRNVDIYGFKWLDVVESIVNHEFPGLPWEWATNKKGNQTIKTPWQGKQVAFFYFDDVVRG